MNNSSHHIGLYLLVVLIGADIQPIICGIGQEGIVTSNLAHKGRTSGHTSNYAQR